MIGGRLVVTTPPEYRKIQQLWTTREFPEDFVLKLEFRATPNADSGVYLRGPQLQCRDYPLAGPYKDLKSYKPQDWNELVVTVQRRRGAAPPATASCSRRELKLPGIRPDRRRGRPRPDGVPPHPHPAPASQLTARAGRD